MRQLCGRIPFQPLRVRDQQAKRGAHNRIQTEIRFIRKADERQSCLRQLALGRAQRACQMLTYRHILGLAQCFEAGRNQSGNQHQADHRQGPAGKRRYDGPAKQEQAG